MPTRKLIRDIRIQTRIKSFYIWGAMNEAYHDAASYLSHLPPEPQEDLLPLIRNEFLASGKTLIVLDDDPTGTQTCYDVTVLTAWSVGLLVEELKKKPSILFILTNSRSVSTEAAVTMAQEIGRNLIAAQKESGRDIAVISRSDSTLRGHFPDEVDALAHALGQPLAVRVLIPAFIEGGRLTIADVHFIHEQNKLTPVAETPFSADKVFGYKNSNLKAWVEEKTHGHVSSAEVVSVSIDDIRTGGPEGVSARLASCTPAQVCIVNAVTHRDLEVVVKGLLEAERAGRKFLYRTSATFVSIRAGLPAGKIYKPQEEEIKSANGSLIIVGSYVPKSTRQLQTLLKQGTHHAIEIDVPKILRARDNDVYAMNVMEETERLLLAGRNVVVHTSRQLQTAPDVAGNLRINNTVSKFLVNVMSRLSVCPSYMIAKGGITASDIATKALGITKASIPGQIIPGVPVWKPDHGSRFPGMLYVVFPGNVGDDDALIEVCRRLTINPFPQT